MAKFTKSQIKVLIKESINKIINEGKYIIVDPDGVAMSAEKAYETGLEKDKRVAAAHEKLGEYMSGDIESQRSARQLASNFPGIDIDDYSNFEETALEMNSTGPKDVWNASERKWEHYMKSEVPDDLPEIADVNEYLEIVKRYGESLRDFWTRKKEPQIKSLSRGKYRYSPKLPLKEAYIDSVIVAHNNLCNFHRRFPEFKGKFLNAMTIAIKQDPTLRNQWGKRDIFYPFWRDGRKDSVLYYL